MSSKDASPSELSPTQHSIWSSMAGSIVALIMTIILSMHQTSSKDDEDIEPAMQGLLSRFSQDANNFMISLNQFCQATSLTTKKDKLSERLSRPYLDLYDHHHRNFNNEPHSSHVYSDDEERPSVVSQKFTDVEKAVQVCMDEEEFVDSVNPDNINVLTVEGYTEPIMHKNIQACINSNGDIVEAQDDISEFDALFNIQNQLKEPARAMEEDDYPIIDDLNDVSAAELTDFQQIVRELNFELGRRASSRISKMESSLETIAESPADCPELSKTQTIKKNCKNMNALKKSANWESPPAKENAKNTLKKENKDSKLKTTNKRSNLESPKYSAPLNRTKTPPVVAKRNSADVYKEPPPSSKARSQSTCRKEPTRPKMQNKSDNKSTKGEERPRTPKANSLNISRSMYLPKHSSASNCNIRKNQERSKSLERSLCPLGEQMKFASIRRKSPTSKSEYGSKTQQSTKRRECQTKMDTVKHIIGGFVTAAERQPELYPVLSKNLEAMKNTVDASISTTNSISGLLTGLEEAQLEMWTERLSLTEQTLEALRAEIADMSGVLSSECPSTISTPMVEVKDQASQSEPFLNEIRTRQERPPYPKRACSPYRCRIPRPAGKSAERSRSNSLDLSKPSPTEIPRYLPLNPESVIEEKLPFIPDEAPILSGRYGIDTSQRTRSSRTRTRTSGMNYCSCDTGSQFSK